MSGGETDGAAQTKAFTDAWTDFASKLGVAGMTFAADGNPPEASRQMRDAVFQAMADQCEAYMRSPQFLETMKQSMDGAVALRKQINEFLTHTYHEMQGVARSDVDKVFLAIKHLGRRLDEVDGRLDEIVSRLEGRGGAGSTVASKAAAVGASRPRTRSQPKTSKKAGKPGSAMKPKARSRR